MQFGYNNTERGVEIMFYLLNIGVSGIKCIKEEVRLDFYKKTVDKNFDPEKYRVKAIYGENGSGKSALITAVKVFKDLIYDENYLNESKTQEFLGEIINKVSDIFCFKMEFLVDWDDKEKRVCQYTLQIGKGRNGLYEIQYEDMKWKNGNYANNKYQPAFESRNGELIFVACKGKEAEWVEKKTINLLSTHSFIYLYLVNATKNMPVAGRRASDLFTNVFACLVFVLSLKVYLADEDQHELFFLRKRLKESHMDQQAVIEGILGRGNTWDIALGVNEKFVEKEKFEKYKENVQQLTQFIKIFKPDLITIDIEAKQDGERYVCDLNLNYGSYVINKEFESTGIKKLIGLFDCFAFASMGGIVFIDEMDANLNDVYLCKLIEYFMYYGKGQLCFTTHNLGPMSSLKENKNSIDFLSSDNHLIPWTSRGNATPENCYRNGMIEDLPFNIEASDFVGIFGE